MNQKTAVRVFAPASVANVAVGYDILGFALNEPGDEIVAGFGEHSGLAIHQITGDNGKLPYLPEKNTAGLAVIKLLEHLQYKERGIYLEIHKKMPFGSGLGSSAASAAGAVLAVNELLGSPLKKQELLPFAVLGEQVADGAYHADNVAPSLLGGIILVRSNATLDVHSLPVPEKLYAAVVHPEVEILTREARSILAREVPLEKLVEQSGNLAGFIIGLYQSDYALISRSLNDVVIEPQRARLIPCFQEVKSTALITGALGCSISGAGPSIFALCDDPDIARKVGEAMGAVFNRHAIRQQSFFSKINLHGAVRL